MPTWPATWRHPRYCETDVLNTWLIWLRFAQLRGRFTEAHHAELERVKALPARGARAAPREFLRAWESGRDRCAARRARRRHRRGEHGRRRAHPRGRGGRARRQDGLRGRRTARRGHALPPHRRITASTMMPSCWRS